MLNDEARKHARIEETNQFINYKKKFDDDDVVVALIIATTGLCCTGNATTSGETDPSFFEYQNETYCCCGWWHSRYIGGVSIDSKIKTREQEGQIKSYNIRIERTGISGIRER